MIGDTIELRVLRIGQDTVRLGVRAPSHVAVHRVEVYEQIRAQNLSAADTTAKPLALATRVRSAAGRPQLLRHRPS